VIDVIPAALLPTKDILPAGYGTTPSSSPPPIEVAYPSPSSLTSLAEAFALSITYPIFELKIYNSFYHYYD
jgi:hypothetical protein